MAVVERWDTTDRTGDEPPVIAIARGPMTSWLGTPEDRKEAIVQDPKMHFILKGFSQVNEFRVFAFEGIAADWTRSPFTVRTNLALTRQYRIRLQELPLLCRTVLERRHEGVEPHGFTFTEEDMRLYADRAAAREEAAKQRRRPRPTAAGHA